MALSIGDPSDYRCILPSHRLWRQDLASLILLEGKCYLTEEDRRGNHDNMITIQWRLVEGNRRTVGFYRRIQQIKFEEMSKV